jgi:hypothetical protein
MGAPVVRGYDREECPLAARERGGSVEVWHGSSSCL